MTQLTEARAGLWTDFDGTAVKHYPKWNGRNWSKYPVALMPGFIDFVHGAQDRGLQPEAIVSRRGQRTRGRVTGWSVSKLGLSEMFPQVQLSGSESEKATRVAIRATLPDRPPVVMLEDKPHSFTPLLADALGSLPEASEVRVVVGAVNTPKTPRYMDETVTALEGLGLETDQYRGKRIEAVGEGFSLTIVALEPYSFTAGQMLAHELR